MAAGFYGYRSFPRYLYQPTAASKLGVLAHSDPSHSFCCGGKLSVQEPHIVIRYKSNEKLAEIILPEADHSAMRKLLDACSVNVSNGDLEGEVSKVIQDSGSMMTLYKKEFYLSSDAVTTSFQLCSTSILSEIESLMVPDQQIKVQLCNLNVCSGIESYYQGHAECSGDTIGTLIVCLPSQFVGGNLAVYHSDQKVEFKWSSASLELQDKAIHWAAIFNGAKFEVLPVTSGFCLTFTYKIYMSKERLPVIPPGNPFYQSLDNALHTPHFMRDGGHLGFSCNYEYANFLYMNDDELLPSLLKGTDYMVCSVAKSLGLHVTIRPVVEGKDHWYLLPKFSDGLGEARKWRDEECTEDVLIQKALQSAHWKERPEYKQVSDIIWCKTMSDWQSVFSLTTSPIQAVEGTLKEKVPAFSTFLLQSPRDQSSHLLSAGICSSDVHIILGALKQLKARSNHQVIGVYTGSEMYGKDLCHCYQAAMLLIEVPPWGQAPRTKANQGDKMKINKSLERKDILYWKK